MPVTPLANEFEVNPGAKKHEILHEQEGLRIRRNAKNGFVVARLHFTAEKAKRDPQWELEAKMGMLPAKFEQEYNIEYTAMFGQKVFPQTVEYKDKIIVREYPTILPSQICYGGLDWGIRNPTSFHVYTVLKNASGENCIHAIWEHYEPTENIEELVRKLKDCQYYEQLKWIAFDPSAFKCDQAGVVPTSIADQLSGLGIKKLLSGSKTFEPQFITLLRQYWRDLDNREPTFKIWDTCPNMINEFQTMIYHTMTDRTLRTKDYKEKMIEKNNHAIDDCKYFMYRMPRLNKPDRDEGPSHSKKGALWQRHMK